jgi:hypothetical protein
MVAKLHAHAIALAIPALSLNVALMVASIAHEY